MYHTWTRTVIIPRYPMPQNCKTNCKSDIHEIHVKKNIPWDSTSSRWKKPLVILLINSDKLKPRLLVECDTDFSFLI